MMRNCKYLKCESLFFQLSKMFILNRKTWISFSRENTVVVKISVAPFEDFFLNYYLIQCLVIFFQRRLIFIELIKKSTRNKFLHVSSSFIFVAESSTVITVNQGVRGGRVTELKKTVDAAVQSCPNVRQVFVAMRTDNPVAMTARDIAMDEVRKSCQQRA